ncbi:MAG: ABC transporter permease [Desulfobacterales bacterium]|nr:ABC transporter permease [Desulfobacterales bacterium]
MFPDLKMAWRNIWRNPRRTLLTVAAIGFASLVLIFMLSFQLGSYQAMINSAVTIDTGHLQVQAAAYRQKKSMRLVVADPAVVDAVLDSVPAIRAYTSRASGFALVSSAQRTYGIRVTGIDPRSEPRVSRLKKLVRSGRFLNNSDRDSALVGILLARNLRVAPGDELTLLGQGRDGSVAAAVVTVRGIFKSGIAEFDRSALYIPLAAFQDIFAMDGAVHKVVAICNSLDEVAPAKQAVAAGLARAGAGKTLRVLDWQELMPGLLQAIQLDLVSGFIFYLLLVLVVAFSILNTFLMAIFERTREFGVLMALGITPGRLTRLLLLESLGLTMVGIAAGIIGGGLFTWYFQVHGLDFSGSSEILAEYGIEGRLYPRLSLLSLLAGPLVVMVITFFAALYPAFKVRRLKPVEALAAN